jgi:hypothetical protein
MILVRIVPHISCVEELGRIYKRHIFAIRKNDLQVVRGGCSILARGGTIIGL